jgi:hypothetical protein
VEILAARTAARAFILRAATPIPGFLLDISVAVLRRISSVPSAPRDGLIPKTRVATPATTAASGLVVETFPGLPL